MQSTKLFKAFLASERAGAFLLMFATAFSLVAASTFLGKSLQHTFHQNLFGMSIEHWVNDGLMVIFFLMIGLELEREVYEGELSWRFDNVVALSPVWCPRDHWRSIAGVCYSIH